MKKTQVIIGVLIALIVGGGAFAYSFSDGLGSTIETTESTNETSKKSLIDSIPKSNAEKNLESFTGDEFDRYFIANMMAHHQGAIDMAELALTNAQHAELKQMANTIIVAQTKEINDMEAWQKTWGYPVSSGEMMIDHSAMGMMGEMDAMNAELKSLTGEAFDKKFLQLMIEHHASAVSMSRPGVNNAGHNEVKMLSAAIIEAQIAEIAQMKQWQAAWGY